MLKKYRGILNFDQFINIFSLKQNTEFSDVDIKNAFRLLSKEYSDGKSQLIKLERIQEILADIDINEAEIEQLVA